MAVSFDCKAGSRHTKRVIPSTLATRERLVVQIVRAKIIVEHIGGKTRLVMVGTDKSILKSIDFT